MSIKHSSLHRSVKCARIIYVNQNHWWCHPYLVLPQGLTEDSAVWGFETHDLLPGQLAPHVAWDLAVPGCTSRRGGHQNCKHQSINNKNANLMLTCPIWLCLHYLTSCSKLSQFRLIWLKDGNKKRQSISGSTPPSPPQYFIHYH